MTKIRALVVLLALALVASVSWAAQTQTAIDVAGLPPLVVTAQAQTMSVLATDSGASPSKRAHVLSGTTVDGDPFVLLLRVEMAPNGLFVDVIGEATIGELTTRVAAMTITGNSHPSVAEDAVDTQVLADAAD